MPLVIFIQFGISSYSYKRLQSAFIFMNEQSICWRSSLLVARKTCKYDLRSAHSNDTYTNHMLVCLWQGCVTLSLSLPHPQSWLIVLCLRNITSNSSHRHPNLSFLAFIEPQDGLNTIFPKYKIVYSTNCLDRSFLIPECNDSKRDYVACLPVCKEWGKNCPTMMS